MEFNLRASSINAIVRQWIGSANSYLAWHRN